MTWTCIKRGQHVTSYVRADAEGRIVLTHYLIQRAPFGGWEVYLGGIGFLSAHSLLKDAKSAAHQHSLDYQGAVV